MTIGFGEVVGCLGKRYLPISIAVPARVAFPHQLEKAISKPFAA
jgi:hypothetical protein